MARSNSTPAAETAENAATAEVMAVPTTIPSEVYANLTSWEDAVNIVADTFGGIVDAAQELGDGFSVVEDKSILIGVPLMLAEWTFRNGDAGEYVSIRALAQTQNGGMAKYIVNDGGAGICKQLRNYTNKTGRKGGLIVKGGLRVSEYEYQPGKWAKTFYLSTAA